MASSARVRGYPGRTIATLAIVSGTFLSVLTGTILNVPLPNIARDLHVSIAQASLLISSQAVVFASFLPMANWVGNRFGRRNVYCFVIALYAVTGAAASFAPNLGVLILIRILQGFAAAGIVPLVMMLLTDLYDAGERPLALSQWAMANSAGQALGPPLGGLLTSLFGWRTIFMPATALAVVACVAAWRFLPAHPPEDVPLEWRGATSLTLAAGFLLTAFIMVPQSHGDYAVPALLALAGCGALALFVHAIRTTAQPFISPLAFREPSYVRSSIGVFCATTAFGAALLAIPLYFTQELRIAVAPAGFLTLLLPLAMALTAPLSSSFVRRQGFARTLLASSLCLALGSAALAVATALHLGVVTFFPAMLLMGAALAAQYTASATGATHSEAGLYGSGIGLFNLQRIAGAAIGPALVAIVMQADGGAYPLVFAIGCAVVLCGLGAAQIIAKPT